MAESVTGLLKNVGKGRFVVRSAKRSYRPGPGDVAVPNNMVREYGLIQGAAITGKAEKGKGKGQLVKIETIGGVKPEAFKKRTKFTELVAVDPHERLDLGASGQESMRMVDLITPIGKGSRQLIVSPPKAGKTVLLEQMVQAIQKSNPECKVIVLLLDERPEEVTGFRRSVEGATVLSSTSDHSANEHAELAEMVLANVQTELECGQDVVLMVDSLTRLGRAFNNRTNRGREKRRSTMSGGLEAGVMEIPRRLFGLARAIEGGGSVTIIATCLINTGSRMDQLIFEEFKGTGNSELVLDRGLAEARIFPAIDIPASGTRKEAKLYSDKHSKGLVTLRRVLSSYNTREAMECLFKLLNKYPSNDEFLDSMCAGG